MKMAKVKKADSKKLLKSLKNIKDIDISKLEKAQEDIFKDLNITESISLLEAMQTEEEIVTQLSNNSLDMKKNVNSTLDEIFYIIFEKVDFNTGELIGPNERIKVIFHKKIDKKNNKNNKNFKITPSSIKVVVKGDSNFSISDYELLGDGVFEITYNQASLKEVKQTVYYKKIITDSKPNTDVNKVNDDLTLKNISSVENKKTIIENHKEDLELETKKIFIEKTKEVLRDLILYNKLELIDDKSIQSYWTKNNDFLTSRNNLINDLSNNKEIDLEDILLNFTPFFKVNNVFSNYMVLNINKFRTMLGLKEIKLLNISEIEQAKFLLESFKSLIYNQDFIKNSIDIDIFIPQWHIYINEAMTLEALSFKIFESYLVYLIQLSDDDLINHFLLDKKLDAFFSIAHTYSYNQKVLINKNDFEKCNDFFEIKYFMHILNLYKIKAKK